MSAYDLVLIVIVAAAAFAAGYQLGRLKTLAERAGAPPRGERSPLPGPEDLDGPLAGPSIPRGPAPPASAGGTPQGRTPPRRSTTPPPAAAGLMGKGAADKPDGRPK